MNSTQASMRARLPQGAAPRQRQRGISLLFLLFIGVLLVIVGGAALKLTPTFIEYRKIQAAIDNSLGEGSPQLIRRSFDRAATIDDITSLTGKDLIIEEVDGKPMVSFDYEKRVSLAGPVSLVVAYRREAY